MLNMTKETEIMQAVTHIGVGAAWKTSGGGRKGLLGRLKGAAGTDLDLSVVALDAEDNPKRICWFDNLDAFDDGSLVHAGDSRTGKGGGDDEFISMDLTKMPRSITKLVAIVSAYKEGVDFSKVEGVTLNVYDMSRGQIKIGDYMPDINTRHNATVILRIVRVGDGWGMAVINEMGNARDRAGLLRLANTYAE